MPHSVPSVQCFYGHLKANDYTGNGSNHFRSQKVSALEFTVQPNILCPKLMP